MAEQRGEDREQRGLLLVSILGRPRFSARIDTVARPPHNLAMIYRIEMERRFPVGTLARLR